MRKLKRIDIEMIVGFCEWRKGTDVPKSQFKCWHDGHNIAAAKRISGPRKGLTVGPCWPTCKRKDRDVGGVTVLAFDKRKFKKHYTPMLVVYFLANGAPCSK